MEHWDCVVVGGGPGGSSTAAALAQAGRRVLLLEADRFPRHHVGESTVMLWEPLRAFGVAEVMDATMMHKYGSTRVWGRTSVPRTTTFEGSGLPAVKPYALQVERSLFDTILLENARAKGADVRQEHRVTAVLWTGDRAVGVRYNSPDKTCREAGARFIVDASGRSGLLARQRGLRRMDSFFPDLSIYGYYRNAARLPGDSAGNLFIEAIKRGWLWFIPLLNGEVSVGVVCDKTSRQELRRCGVNTFFLDAVDESVYIRDFLSPAALVAAPRVTASFGYTSARYAGPGWLLVGDAANFIDPMWATGVANAILTGWLAAARIDEALRGHQPEERLLSSYHRSVTTVEPVQMGLVKRVYGSNRLHADEPFWRARHDLLQATPPMGRETLRALGHDPALSYFRNAFSGMEAPEVVAMLDQARADADASGSLVGNIAPIPATT